MARKKKAAPTAMPADQQASKSKAGDGSKPAQAPVQQESASTTPAPAGSELSSDSVQIHHNAETDCAAILRMLNTNSVSRFASNALVALCDVGMAFLGCQASPCRSAIVPHTSPARSCMVVHAGRTSKRLVSSEQEGSFPCTLLHSSAAGGKLAHASCPARPLLPFIDSLPGLQMQYT